MKINLYPYNMYALYIAIGLLVLFLIYTLVKTGPLLNALNRLTPQLEHISKNSESLNEKLSALQPKEKKKKLSPQEMFNLLLLYSAIRKDYKKKETKGFKQIGKSTTNVLYNKQKQQMITDQLLKIIGRK